MRHLVLAGVAGVMLFGSTVRAQGQDDPRVVLGRAIQAHGGADRIMRLKAVHVKTHGTLQLNDASVAFVADTLAQMPSQIKNVFECEMQGKKRTVTELVNGEQVALFVDGQKQSLTERATAEVKDLVYAERAHTLVPLLFDRAHELTAAGPGEAEGRPTTKVKVTAVGHQDLVLHFDRANGLLVKTERQALDLGKLQEVAQEEYYSAFQESEGLVRPMKVVVFKNGKKFLESEATEVKYFERLDDRLFTQP